MRYTPKHYASKQSASRIRIASISVASAATLAAGVGFAAAPANAAGGGVWDRVAACESGGNWSISTGNGFSGGLQFTPSTWRAFGGHGSPTTASKAEQIRVAQRTLAVQGPRAWPVCSIKAGLTRANGGAASSAPSTDVSRSTVRQAPVQKHYTAKKHEAPVQKHYTAMKHEAPVQKHYTAKKHEAPVQKHYTAKKNTWVAPKRATQQAAAPQVAVPTAAPASNLREITVKQGDTLAKLAAQYDLSNWQEIFAVNRATVQDPNLIFIGQSLNLPS